MVNWFKWGLDIAEREGVRLAFVASYFYWLATMGSESAAKHALYRLGVETDGQ